MPDENASRVNYSLAGKISCWTTINRLVTSNPLNVFPPIAYDQLFSFFTVKRKWTPWNRNNVEDRMSPGTASNPRASSRSLASTTSSASTSGLWAGTAGSSSTICPQFCAAFPQIPQKFCRDLAGVDQRNNCSFNRWEIAVCWLYWGKPFAFYATKAHFAPSWQLNQVPGHGACCVPL